MVRVWDKTWPWLVLFLMLSSMDAALTNYGIGRGLGHEGNPVLAPFAGTWLLYLKTVVFLPLAVLVSMGSAKLYPLVAKWKMAGWLLGPIPLRRILVWTCLVLGAVCIWNAGNMGLI